MTTSRTSCLISAELPQLGLDPEAKHGIRRVVVTSGLIGIPGSASAQDFAVPSVIDPSLKLSSSQDCPRMRSPHDARDLCQLIEGIRSAIFECIADEGTNTSSYGFGRSAYDCTYYGH